MAFGYVKPQYGASFGQKPAKLSMSPLTQAASGGVPTIGDPFGLTAHPGAPSIDGTTVAPRAPSAAPPAQGPVSQPPPAVAPAPPTGPQAPPVQPAYDINTDPVLQQVNAYAGKSDAEAQAMAEKDRRDALLQYGDQKLVESVLGDKTLAQAAGQNPTSTLAQLGHQKDTSLHDLLNSLTSGGHHLGNSGYRIAQEGELGNQFQNALAQAASGVNGQLGGISAQLRAALGQSNDRRAGALGDAYNRHSQDAMNNPPAAPPPGPNDNPNDPFGGAGSFGADDYLKALMLAAATHKGIAL